MLRDRNFLRVTFADLIVRAAYQMGKTPLLPIFAAALGAGDILLGFIVSVSTMTGMVAKPLVGYLSDRWGRRLWLVIGTVFFGLIPFLYWFVQTPQQLIAIRIVHGMATAIYGPVTLAFVAEKAQKKRAETLGWFSNAKSIGYVVGPALGGVLLLYLSPQWVFTIIGIASCLAFIPILNIEETTDARSQTTKRGLRRSVTRRPLSVVYSSALWLAGGIESITYVALYALKAFLPIYALSVGFNSAEIGTFFAIQETAAIVAKPAGGRLADRRGNLPTIIVGMLGISAVLPFVPIAPEGWHLLLLAAALGACQGVLFPATTALIAEQIDSQKLGTGMGLAGTLRNAGKVAGPIIAGALLTQMPYQTLFTILSMLLMAVAIGLIFAANGRRPKKIEPASFD